MFFNRRFLKSSVAILLISLLFYFGYTEWESFEHIFDITWQNLSLLCCVVILNLMAQGYCAKVVTEISGVKIGYQEAFGLKILQLTANYIIPFSGWGFRALFLKRVYGLLYRDYSAGVMGKFLVEIVVYSIGGILALLFSLQGNFETGISLVVVLTVICCGAIGLMFLPLQFIRIRKFSILTESWISIRKSKSNIRKLFFVNLIEFVSFAFTFYAAAYAYNLEVSLTFPFLTTSLSNLSLYLRLAPGAIGTYEAFVYMASHYYHISLANSMLISTSIRVVTIILFLLLAPIFAHILAKKSNIDIKQIFTQRS